MQFGFNPNDAPDQSNDFDLIPKGWQPMKLKDVEEKRNQRGWVGARCAFEITSGPHAGRRVWPQFTTACPYSKVAEEIGQSAIKSLCHAAHRPDAQGFNELIGIEVEGRIGIEKGRDGYDDKNDVKAFRPVDTGAPAVATGNPHNDDDLPF